MCIRDSCGPAGRRGPAGPAGPAGPGCTGPGCTGPCRGRGGRGRRRSSVQAAPAASGPQCRGTIKKMVRDRGFGFIRGEDGKEVFYHRSGLNAADYDGLSVGDAGEYVVQEGPRGARAENVRQAAAGDS